MLVTSVELGTARVQAGIPTRRVQEAYIQGGIPPTMVQEYYAPHGPSLPKDAERTPTRRALEGPTYGCKLRLEGPRGPDLRVYNGRIPTMVHTGCITGGYPPWYTPGYTHPMVHPRYTHPMYTLGIPTYVHPGIYLPVHLWVHASLYTSGYMPPGYASLCV